MIALWILMMGCGQPAVEPAPELPSAPKVVFDGPPGHCRPDEDAVFVCRARGDQWISLCGSSPEIPLQLRFGSLQRPQFVLPPIPSGQVFAYRYSEQTTEPRDEVHMQHKGGLYAISAAVDSRLNGSLKMRVPNEKPRMVSCEEITRNRMAEWGQRAQGASFEGQWAGPGWVLELSDRGQLTTYGRVPCGATAGAGTWRVLQMFGQYTRARASLGEIELQLEQPLRPQPALTVSCRSDPEKSWTLKRR